MRAAKQAEDAASKLRNLVHRPQVVQLLQRPLPAAPTAEQQAVLASCSSTLQQLMLALTDSYNSRSGTESVVQVLRRTLRHQPVHSAGVLLAWLQQQPQQLAASLKSSRGLDPGTLEAVWTVGMLMVAGLADLLLECYVTQRTSRASTAALAELGVDLTQQLLQSGERISCCGCMAGMIPSVINLCVDSGWVIGRPRAAREPTCLESSGRAHERLHD